MRPRAALAVIVITVAALWIWRSQLFTVSRPGERPRPLVVRAASERAPVAFDVVLPAVPVGMERLRSRDQVLLIHYWAPWERHGAVQAAGLDSLARILGPASLRTMLVCFDPFPSVARYVARQRLRVRVLLDSERLLRDALPCPSVPYTYVIDAAGRVAVAQPGEVDWLAPETLRALGTLLADRTEPRRSARNAVELTRGTSEGGLGLTIFWTAPRSPLVPGPG
jgi:hypothetical protein